MNRTISNLGRISLWILTLTLLSSHELFLKSDAFFLEENSSSELYLFNGTFDSSENLISRDRIVEDRILGPGFDLKPEDSAYLDVGKSTHLRFTTGSEGTYVAGVSTLPNMIDMSAEDFLEYLEHEELTGLISKRSQQGISDLPVKEKYSKHVKALLQVGDASSEHFSTILGYPIEFVPIQNPYDLKVGDKISFQLLFRDLPLGRQSVHASNRPDGIDPFAEEILLETDPDGVVTLTINEKGQWYLATIFIEESNETGVDYESNWATITFGVR